MLKRVEIKNFRSCQDVVLDNLGPMTVLVGRNAVGKTNILRAIQWAADTATSQQITHYPEISGHVSLHIAVGDGVYHYSINVRDVKESSGEKKTAAFPMSELLNYEDNSGQINTILVREQDHVNLKLPDSNFTIQTLTPCMPVIDSFSLPKSSQVNCIRPLISILKKICYYTLENDDFYDNNLGLLAKDRYVDWESKFRTLHDPGQSVLLRLFHLYISNDPKLQELRSLLGQEGLGLVEDIDIRPLESVVFEPSSKKLKMEEYYRLSFQPNSQSSYFNFGNLSAGTQRIIRLLLSLIFDQSSVMLVEHPEDSIHQGLLRKLLGVLRMYSGQSQLILSSHSSVVFNTLDPRAIRLVTMEEGNTKVRPLTPDELSAADKFMEEEGSLSDFIETVEEE